MNIIAVLTIPHDVHLGRGFATISVIESLENSDLSFQGVSFKPGKMLVEVLLDTDQLNAPRHEGEAEEEIRKECDKANLDCSILIIHGTQYVDESKGYEPQMTPETQLRHGE